MNKISGTLLKHLEIRAEQQQCSLNQLLQNWLDRDNQSDIKPDIQQKKDDISSESVDAEIIVQEYETRFRIISDLMSGYAFVMRVRPDLTVELEWITANTFLDITGYTAEETIRNGWDKLAPPEDLPRLQQTLIELSTSPSESRSDYEIVTKTGDIRHVELVIRSIADKDGRVDRIYGAILDITERKVTEKTLRESEARYRAVINALAEGIILQDLDGVVRDSNVSAKRILGLSSDQMTRFSLADSAWCAIHEDGQAFTAEDRPGIAALRTGKSDANVIMGVTRPDGMAIWLSINSQPLVHPDENIPYAVVTSFADITTLKHSADSLAQREDRYRQMFEHNSAVQLLIDPSNGRFIQVSPAACDFYGYTAEQFLTLNVADINILSAAAIQVEMEKARQAKRNFFQFQHRLASGEIRDVDIYSGPVEVGGETYLYSIIQDVTERKRIEQALRESEARYRAVVNAMAEGVVIQDAGGHIRAANPSAGRILGLTDDQLLGHTEIDPKWYAIDQHETVLPHEQWLNITRFGITPSKSTVTIGVYNPTGELTWISMHAQPLIFLNEPPPYAMVITFSDITEHIQFEATLKRQIHELEILWLTEAALKDNRHFTEQITRTIPDLIYIHDLFEQRAIYSNHPISRMLAYSADETVAVDQFDLARFMHPDDLGKMNAHQKQYELIPDNEIVETEFRLKHADGDWHMYQTRNAVFKRTPEGHPWQILGIARDVTSQKQAEVALRESEDRYRAVIAVMVEGVIVGSEHAVRTVNASAERLLGLTPVQMTNRAARDPRWSAVREDGTPFPLAEHPLSVTLHSGEPKSKVIMGIYKPESEVTWLSINTQPLINSGESKPYAVVATLSDITERIQFEAVLNSIIEQLVTLRAVDAELTDHLDLQRRFEVSLTAAIQMTKADSGYIALLEQNVLQIAYSQGDGHFKNNLFTEKMVSELGMRVFQSRQAEFVSDSSVDSNGLSNVNGAYSQIGCPLIVQDRIIGVMVLEANRAGQFTTEAFNFVQVLVGRIAVAIDNARLYSLSQQQVLELQELYDKVRALEQLKSDMIRIGAHDLKNPLGLVLGFTDLLKSDLWETLSEENRHVLDQIQKGAERMLRIISDILSLERIEAIGTQSTYPLDLSQLVTTAFRELIDQAQSKSQKINLMSLDCDLTVSGDEAQLYEAITNLISNAIKYTPNEGSIEVKLETVGNQAVFTVKDTGYGVPLDMQARLFQPFFRAKTDQTSDIEGTGLGLHLVKNVVERCNGKIIFESAGQGSLFGFQLPLIDN